MRKRALAARDLVAGAAPPRRGAILKVCAIQLFDRTRSHLFDASNSIQDRAHPSTQADRSAKSTPTVLCLGSKASFPNYAVELEERCFP